MPDADHIYGNDLSLSPTGDLAMIAGPESGRQRIIRRLMSNPSDLMFHPEYGAGLPRRVGDPRDVAAVRSVVTRQMFAEAAVSRNPPPEVGARPIPGGVVIRVRYTDADTATQLPIGFTVET